MVRAKYLYWCDISKSNKTICFNKCIYQPIKDGRLEIEEKVRGGSKTAATSKIELFVIILNGWKPLTIITKCSIFDAAAALDPPLKVISQHVINSLIFIDKIRNFVLLFKMRPLIASYIIELVFKSLWCIPGPTINKLATYSYNPKNKA